MFWCIFPCSGNNEVIWRCFSTDIWVTFKFLVHYCLFVFLILQMSFFEKHLIKEKTADGDTSE